MNDFGILGVVEDVDGHALTFAKTQEGTGSGAVVADGPDDLTRGNFQFDGGNAQSRVGFDVISWEKRPCEIRQYRQTSPASQQS
jgi:hypothetical protein